MIAHWWWLATAALVLIGLVMTWRIIMSPELKYHGLAYKFKSKLFFWLGDIRLMNAFPWVTWASREHGLSMKSVREGASACRPGYVGLHRDDGFLSNVGIPGTFKHAWIIVDHDDCVEAVSEGVLRRDCMTPLLTDYAVILRPVGVDAKDVDKAMRRANLIVGSDYDANFNFNLEEADANLGGYARNISAGAFHPAFSCTETVGFAWYCSRDALRLFRTQYAGREAIIADDFLRMEFEIAWAAPSVTMAWAKSMGMHEEGRRKLARYLDERGDDDDHQG